MQAAAILLVVSTVCIVIGYEIGVWRAFNEARSPRVTPLPSRSPMEITEEEEEEEEENADGDLATIKPPHSFALCKMVRSADITLLLICINNAHYRSGLRRSH
jgi:hypothetical protein